MNSFELDETRYNQLKQMGCDEIEIKNLIETWGLEEVNKGYCEFVSYLSDEIIPNALHIEAIGDVGAFDSDSDACIQAEKDGVEFINDIDGLEKRYYIDTLDNRKYCIEMLEKYPKYRIENWIRR